MDLFSHPCPCCFNDQVHLHVNDMTQSYGLRSIFHCRRCDIYFSETFATPIAGLRTPLSRIIEVLKAKTEGMSLQCYTLDG